MLYVGYMPILKADDKRRIVLPKDYTEAGEEFVAIKIKDEIILKPLPRDAVKALEKQGRKLKGMSLKQIRKTIERQALKEVK